MIIQQLDKFKLPHNFRGRNAFIVQLWWLVQGVLFRTSPQFLYGFRRFLLRLFGAKIGKNVIIGGQAGISGHLKIGDYVQIAGGSGVIKDVPSKSKIIGYPAKNLKEFIKKNK